MSRTRARTARLGGMSALLACAALGCAFPGGQLGALPQGESSRDGALAAVGYEFSVGPEDGVISDATLEKGLRLIGPAFSAFERSNASHPYQLRFRLRSECDPLVRRMLVGVSVVTLALLPVRLRDPISLDVEFASDGRVTKTWHYDDHVDTWVQLVMIPLDPQRRRPQVVQQVVDRMLMTFLRDYEAGAPLPMPAMP